MSKPDFTYLVDGIFTMLMPETEQATQIWNDDIAPATDGTGKFLSPYFETIRDSLRRKGYIVEEAAPITESNEELLSQLKNN